LCELKIEYAAKAILVVENSVLLVKNNDEFGEWYGLPGGRQLFGETLEQTLRRECLEEVGIRISSFNLKFVREYIHKNHEYRDTGRDIHKVELMYLCDIDRLPPTIKQGEKPDINQIGQKWVQLSELKKLRIHPKRLCMLGDLLGENLPQYWGDVL